MRTYWRRFYDDPDTTQEMTEEQFRCDARDNVHDVELAMFQGFETANARYWTEAE